MKRNGSLEELGFGFDPLWVPNTAIHWADCGALLLVVEANTLGVAGGIDLEAQWTLGDRLVGTLGLADAAVDARICDRRCHHRLELNPKLRARCAPQPANVSDRTPGQSNGWLLPAGSLLSVRSAERLSGGIRP